MTERIPMLEKLHTRCPRCGAKPGESCGALRVYDTHRMATFHKERRDAAIAAREEQDAAEGNCYQVAANYLARLSPKQAEGHTLVHGVVIGQGPLDGRRVDHAWVEVEGGHYTVTLVVDRSNGRNLLLPRDMYYRLGRIVEAECTRYTPEETRTNMLRTEHFGPWEEKSS